MERRFVKLGEQYYMVEATEKGLSLVPATKENILDEEFEHAVVGTEADLGDNFLQSIINEAKEEMVKHLKAGLKETVLACLGFEKTTWGGQNGFRVDHCNNRMSEVGNHIKVTLQEILGKTKVEDLGITPEEKTAICRAYRQDLLNSYKDTMRQSMWRAVESMAKEDAQKVANSLVKERNEIVGKIVLDKLFASVPKKV